MTDHLFISAGMHYYVAGRYAVFAGLNPTAANLVCTENSDSDVVVMESTEQRM